MPGTHEFAEVSFTLSDLIVMKYNITTGGFIGAPVSLADGQLLEIDPEADTDKQRGYGAIKRTLSVTIGAKIKLAAGGVDIDAAAIIYGLLTQSSGADPNQVRTADVGAGGSGLPYWSVIGVSPTDDGGVAVVGLKANKLDKVPKWTLDGKANKFNMSEADGYSIPVDTNVNRFFRVKFYQTASDWSAPTNGTQFSAFFSAPA